MNKIKLYFKLACLTGSIFLNSCETYNFSQPQPIDKGNIYEFPTFFQGKWISKSDSESVYVYKRGVKYVTNEYEERIIKGAWPRLDSNGQFVSPPFSAYSLFTIKYDSLRRPIDTISNYLLRDGYIYAITYDDLIENGKPYHLQQDTIFVANRDSIWLDLGQNAFLRKISNTIYSINILNRTVGMENTWWQVLFLKENDNGTITLFGCENRSRELSSLLYSKGSNYYFNSKWTSDDILRLIKEGYISEGVVLMKDQK